MSANLACRLFDLITWSSARSFNMNLNLIALDQVEQVQALIWSQIGSMSGSSRATSRILSGSPTCSAS